MDNELYKDLVFNKDLILIIPTEDKPVKIVFEQNPCPKDSAYRCEHSELLINNGEITFLCRVNCERKVKK